MRSLRIPLALALVLVGCSPRTRPPVRLVLSTSTVPLQWGEQQTVTARAFAGTAAQDLSGLTWSSSDETIAALTLGENGDVVIRGAGAGTATVTAHLADATADVTVTVAQRVLVLTRIDVSADSTMIPRGLRVQLHATGVYDDGSTKDLSSTAAWASADGMKATVSGTGLVNAVNVGTVEVRALKSGVVGTLSLTVTAASLSAIDVRPTMASLAIGTQQAFTATGRYSDGSTQPLTAMVTWSSSDTTTLAIDAGGRATAQVLGTADVTASFDGINGTAHVTITDATLRTLEAMPLAFTLPLGSTRALGLSGHFSDGTTQDLTAQATWRSGTPAVASVDDAGVVLAVAQGLSVVTANVGAISATSSVTVTAAQLQALQVAPQAPSVPLGLNRALTATGVYTDGTTRDLTAGVVWSSADGGVATVSNLPGENGLMRTVGEGTTVVSASNGSLTGNTTVTVAPPILLSLQLTPPMVSIPVGRTQALHANGSFSDGTMRDVTATVAWTSADAGVATVSNDAGTEGIVSAVAVGQTSIDATLGLVTASRTVVVTAPTLQRLDVTATSSSVAKGRTRQLTAMGTYSDGSTANLTASVTWAPATGATLRVSSGGLLTALQEGSANATATLGSTSGSLLVTVTAAELDSISLTPPTPTIALGLTRQLTAQGTWSDGTVTALSSGVTWSSVDSLVASVSSSGLVFAAAQGQTQVSASLGGLSGSTLVTVGAPVLTSIELSATTLTLDKNQTQQVMATGTFSDGNVTDVTSTVAWSTTPSSVASVTAGLVTALTPGTCTLSATQAGVTATANITVNRPALASLAVTPVSPHVSRGSTLPFVATATYVDASTEVVTALVAWSSTNGAVASIGSNGVASGLTEGSSTITASWNSQSDSTLLTVDPLSLVSIAITGATRVANGSSVALVATGTLADATTTDLTSQVTWVSSSPSVVTFANASGVFGVAHGASVGSSNITATLASVTSPAFTLGVLDTNAPYVGRCGPGLIISQVYGGGGNTGAPVRNDFVELHNPTASPISLQGLSIQYGASGGTTWANNVALSNVSIAPGGYYLVMMAGGANGSTFTPDQSATGISMATSAGKVALVNGTVALTGACPTAGVIDFVGYGGANCSEGTTAPAPSNTTSVVRGASGCRDANQNNNDFTTTATITPRSSATTAVLCSCFVNETDVTEELNACQLQTANLVVAAAAVSSTVSSLVTQPGVTDAPGFSASLRVQVGFGPVSASPTAAGWSWWPARGATAGTSADSYDGVFVAPVSGSFGFTSRVSVDGVNWTACDLNGAGSGTGLALETGQLGALSVP